MTGKWKGTPRSGNVYGGIGVRRYKDQPTCMYGICMKMPWETSYFLRRGEDRWGGRGREEEKRGCTQTWGREKKKRNTGGGAGLEGKKQFSDSYLESLKHRRPVSYNIPY